MHPPFITIPPASPSSRAANFRSGLYSIYLDPTFQPPSTQPNAGQTYTIGKHYNFIPQLFLTHSFENSPVSVGLGVYAPYGGNMDWPQNTGFRAVATYGSLKYFRANPVIAFKLAPNLSIGGGVMVDYGRLIWNKASALCRNLQISIVSQATAGVLATIWEYSGNRLTNYPSVRLFAATPSSP